MTACQLARNWMEEGWPHKGEGAQAQEHTTARHQAQTSLQQLTLQLQNQFLPYSATNDSGASSLVDTLGKIPGNEQLRE